MQFTNQNLADTGVSRQFCKIAILFDYLQGSVRKLESSIGGYFGERCSFSIGQIKISRDFTPEALHPNTV